MKLLIKCCSALLLISLCSVSQASLIRLKMEWSGSEFGNSLRADGFLTFDNQLLPGYYPDALAPPEKQDKDSSVALPSDMVIELSLVIVSPLLGTEQVFGLEDFSSLSFGAPYTYAPAPLDLSRELVGQDVGLGCQFGIPSGAGWDCSAGSRAGTFNLKGKPGAPEAYSHFTILTADGYRLRLESLRPAEISEPTSWSLMLVCLAFLIHLNCRHSRSAK